MQASNPTGTPSQVCRFFLQNSCMRGDRCHYYHPRNPTTELNASPSQAPRTACVYYGLGTCRYGDQCHNAHIPSSVDGYRPTMKTIPALPPTPSAFGPCKFFNRGCCARGDTCPFPHVQTPHSTRLLRRPQCPPNMARPNDRVHIPIAMSPSGQEETPTTVERIILGSKVTFGPGASIERVQTAFESSRLFITNLPVNSTTAGVIKLVEEFGELRSVNVDSGPSASFATARIDFTDCDSASRAVDSLNGREFHEKRLAARLDLSAVETGSASLLCRKIKISWYAPHLAAWAHYPTISKAMAQAKRLHNGLFDSRKVMVHFQPPKPRQTTSFSIEIKGLPPRARADDIKRWSHASSVTLGQPTYEEGEGEQYVREQLSKFGTLESFDLVPATRNHVKIKAFAQFHVPEAAAAAVEKLHNERQRSLGSPLWLELIYSVKYNPPLKQLALLKSEIDALTNVHTQCRIRYYEEDSDGQAIDPACIRIYSSYAKALGKVKAAVESLIQGEVLMLEGHPIWNDFLTTSDGREVITSINDASGCFVKCHIRSRTINLSGPASNRGVARAAILTKLEELMSRKHVLSMDSDMMRELLTGGMKTLWGIAENIILDVVARTLTVHGSQEEVERVHRAVASMRAIKGIPITPRDSACPVCFCDITDPTTLPCGHSYCRACLEHFLRSATEVATSALACITEISTNPNNTCGNAIPLAVLRNLLSPDEEAKLFETALVSHINARTQTYRYCPTPDCPVIYRPAEEGTVLRCPVCLNRICAACHVEFHEGLTCAEHRDNASGNLDAFRKWREEHDVRPCPKCGVHMEKNGGCNHMACIGCKTHICWVCMKTFPDEDTATGVYKHMREKHGGIGI
ncbi:hypothetical protein NEOLEDRAFT_1059755 [Neolentinus lepideus HHB14362 ss-1]|uniref:RBR-type E3 ubiquitin transferase n=1 Tax=Neolentinus lepideus HHB14362 ss-1 TaxID=1314782 RepID=A0A165UAL3_9AGAM|nr:hypothetical protein NEOLEDRAFT_1059755 [Neolentinus lepideus HHB14362 ss-1]